MPSKFIFLFLLPCFIAVTVKAQDEKLPSLTIGSPAPPLRVREWLKGKPISGFEKGKVYVVEFWATWCGPCIEEMPRLSYLARKYKGKVTVVGMNIYERKSALQVRAFVDSMAHWMKYNVAAQDSNFMETGWMDAAGESGIPSSFVVDRESRIAWIGYTAYLPGPLAKIVGNDWDLGKAKAQMDLDKHNDPIGEKTSKNLRKFTDTRYMTDFYGEPDSVLYFINKLTTEDTSLNFEYRIAADKLSALLRKNSSQAYEYGKILMAGLNPNYDAIIHTLWYFPYQYNTLPKKYFELAAEACQAKIDLFPWSMKSTSNYFKMAEWYLLADNKPKAKQAMRKAIKALKAKKKGPIVRSL